MIALITVPTPEDGDEALMNDENWRIVYATPIWMSEIIPMILIGLFFKVPSINEVMSSNDVDKQLLDEQLKRIFIIKSEKDLEQARKQIYREQIVTDGKDDKEDATKASLWDAITKK